MQSIHNKLDDISAEVYAICAHVVCVTETRQAPISSNEITYSLDGYNSYCNYRKEMAGGGCMLYIHNTISTI